MSKPVPGSGDPSSPIWMIGEAPGQSEVVQGEPFVGNAGKTLRRYCMQIGIDPNDCYLDNVFNERAPSDELSRLFKDGSPNSDVSFTIAALNRKIEKYRPNVIIALGAIPTFVLTGKTYWNPKYNSFSGIHDVRGCIYEHKSIKGQKVIPTFHPSFINRPGYNMHGVFLCDLQRVIRESKFPEIRRPKKEFILNPRGTELLEVKERLINGPGDILTVDIEYAGSRLLCIGFTTASDWATSIATDSPTMIDHCREILSCGKGLNAQNSMFDCSILEYHYDIPMFKHIEYDTMLAAHAINPELPKDLGFLNSIYTDQPNHKDMIDWEAIKKGEQDFSDLYEYNAIDVWTQHKIMECQLEEDFEGNPELWKTFRFEMDLLGPLWEISKRGMLVDQERKESYRKSLEEELEFERTLLAVLNGGIPVNVKSGDDVAELLFNFLGLRPGGKTAKGKYKTDDKTMASLLGRAENERQKLAIRTLRSARRKRDLFSKFIDAEIDDDGRTRGMYNPGGTKTGRLASKKFYPTGKGHQQQNIPREGRIIIIPDKGMTFGSVDYERAESLCVAHLTNDATMLKHHEPGEDAHTLLGTMFFEKDFDDITKDERYLMKKTRHAGNYMEGHITFMRDINKDAHKTGVSVTTKEAKEFIEWYRSIHAGLRPWWLDIREQLYTKKKLITMLKRERTFFDRAKSILPKAVAFVPQGTVGDLMNLGLLNVSGVITPRIKDLVPWWEEIPDRGEELKGLGFQLLNQVHDSIGFQFPPENEDRIIEIVSSCLEIPLQNPHTLKYFTIGVDFEFGKSWGEAT